MNDTYKDKKFIIISLFLGIVGIFCVTIGSSYAYLTYEVEGKAANIITSGSIDVAFNDYTNAIFMDNAMPVTDDVGLSSSSSHVFTVTNNSSIPVNYKLMLTNVCNEGDTTLINDKEEVVDKCIPLSYVKVAIKKDDGAYDVLSVLDGTSVDLTDMIRLNEEEESATYTLKLWLSLDTPNEYQGKDEDNKPINSLFMGKLEVFSEQILQEVSTKDECFVLNGSVITDYKCFTANPYGLENISYVLIPSSIKGVVITGISDYAFANKGLKKIKMESSIPDLSPVAFDTGVEIIK